jgi:hypothetical protein
MQIAGCVARRHHGRAGQSGRPEVAGGGKLAYLDFDGKPGKPATKGGGGRSAPAAAKEPALVDVPADYKDTLPFAFSKGDTVAILGNGLPDRMQHDGWMETVLQSALPEQNVRFRNMSASGDRPNSFPRSGGHMHMTDYLRHVKPDVVFAFFGYYQHNILKFVSFARTLRKHSTTQFKGQSIFF